MVEWYLDGQELNDVITTTVLDNPVTTQYTNTLTVTERRGGRYKCYVISVDDRFLRETDFAMLGVQSMFIKNGLYISVRDGANLNIDTDVHCVCVQQYTCYISMNYDATISYCFCRENVWYRCLDTPYIVMNSLSVFHTVGSPPTEVRVLQESPTTIHVFWEHPKPVGSTTGYQIYYTGPTEGSFSADSIDINNEIITGLVNGQTYYVSVTGKSSHLDSEPVAAYNGPISLSK